MVKRSTTKTKAPSTLQVHTMFSDDRYPGYAITWQAGSDKLRLVSSGGTQGTPLVLQTLTLDKNTYDTAEEEAKRWFSALPFEDDTVPEPEWRDE